MSTVISSPTSESTCTWEETDSSLSGTLLVYEHEAEPTGNRAARGLITAVVMGAGMWGAILVLAGVIKL